MTPKMRKAAPPRLDDLPDLLTVEEFACWARRGRNRAYEDVRLGLVPSVLLGRTLRIPKAALVRFLETAGERAADTPGAVAPLPLRRRVVL
jgi:hypothetical protein